MNQRTHPLRFAEVNLTTGVRLRHAARGDPAGHPIILLHGYTDSWFSFSRVLPLLSPSYRSMRSISGAMATLSDRRLHMPCAISPPT